MWLTHIGTGWHIWLTQSGKLTARRVWRTRSGTGSHMWLTRNGNCEGWPMQWTPIGTILAHVVYSQWRIPTLALLVNSQ